MVASIPLPDVFYGSTTKPQANWRSLQDDSRDDDELLPKTPDDVIALLGFDPLHVDADGNEPTAAPVPTHDAEWEESKHKRGQPGNAGQFSSGGGGGTKKEPPNYIYNPNWNSHVHIAMTTIQDWGDDPDLDSETKVSMIEDAKQKYAKAMGIDYVPIASTVGTHAQNWIDHLTGGDVAIPEQEPNKPPEAAPIVSVQKSTTVHKFTKAEGLSHSSMNGIPFSTWTPPTTVEAWAKVEGQNEEIDEPELPPLHGNLKRGSGVLIREPDGRVWIVSPSNSFGGYKNVFPKGKLDDGLSLQANAIKEGFEESGLKVKITGFAGDFEHTTSITRYYYAERVGGSPIDYESESDAVTLAPIDKLSELMGDMPAYNNIIANALSDKEKPLHEQQLYPASTKGWQKIGGQLGSNPGGQFTAPNGESYYAKIAKSQDHARNEHLASLLYALVGSPVLEHSVLKGDSLGGAPGSYATATKWTSQTPANITNETDRKAMQKDFATHAWLGNWDGIGTGTGQQMNQAKIGGKMHSVDLGGSLLYRAKGEEKGSEFGNDVPEWNTFRAKGGKAKEAAEVFHDMSNKELFDSARNVAKADPEKVFNTVIQHGPGGLHERLALADKILARRDDIVNRANKLGQGEVHV
jgi:ADP-ribose pyrophosphatase YjhB (NUDIX family)